jgi:hypothetical protein
MSVDQRVVHDPKDDLAREGLRKQVEEWFVKHGVPQFAEPYVPSDRLRFLVLPLAVLVAFEVGAAPKLRSLPALLLIPPVVVGLAAWARPYIWRLLGRKQEQGTRLNRLRLLSLLAVLLLLSASLVWWSDWPPPWSDAWVDFGIILLAEWASMLILTREVWSGTGDQLGRLRRRLFACIVAAVLVFAFLLTLDQQAVIDSRQLLNDLIPGQGQIPLALPALGWMMLIVTLADRTSQAANPTTASQPADPRIEPHVAHGQPPRGVSPWAAAYPALPLLILVFAAQTTVLREARTLGWMRAWLPLVVGMALFALSAAAWRISLTDWWRTCNTTTRRWLSDLGRRLRLPQRREPRTGPPVLGRAAWDRMYRGAGHPLFLAPLLAACLIGYPAKMGTGLGVEVFSWTLVLPTAAALMFAVYVFLVWFFVWFGLDRVSLWVWRELWNDRMQIVQGVAGGLPLLLVFAAFFALTAETWEVVVETQTPKFLALIGLLVALLAGVMFLLTTQQLRNCQLQLTAPEPDGDQGPPGNGQAFDPWQRLREQALRPEPSKEEPTTAVIRKLFETASPSGHDLSPKLQRRMRVNARLVIAVYQAMVLVPVGLSALLLFWGVGRLAVSKGVAAEWIYGDNAGEAEERLVDQLSFLGEPWTRVPIVLAAFSVLYLAVTLLTSKDQHQYFFAAANAALRQRLAVRVAYRIYFVDPVPGPGHGNGATRSRGRDRQRRASTAPARGRDDPPRVAADPASKASVPAAVDGRLNDRQRRQQGARRGWLWRLLKPQSR